MEDFDKYADVVMVSVETHFSWPDRLRILFGWKLHELTPVGCEYVPGWTETLTTRVSFMPPGLVLRLRRHRQGYGEVAPGPEVTT